MATIKPTGSNGRRVLYFREDSKRDNELTEREEEARYRLAMTPFCEDCCEKYSLQSGKNFRMRIDRCGICGELEARLVGSLYNDNDKIFKAKCEWTRNNRHDIPEACFIDNNSIEVKHVVVPFLGRLF